jgi:hypothetical protein
VFFFFFFKFLKFNYFSGELNLEANEQIISDLFEYSEHLILRTMTKEALESFYDQTLGKFIANFSNWKFKREYNTIIAKGFFKLGLIQVKKIFHFFFFLFFSIFFFS